MQPLVRTAFALRTPEASAQNKEIFGLCFRALLAAAAAAAAAGSIIFPEASSSHLRRRRPLYHTRDAFELSSSSKVRVFVS